MATMLDVHELLLLRRGLVFVESAGGQPAEQALAQAAALNLTDLGYVPSARLLGRMGQVPVEELTRLQGWLRGVLAAAVGGGQAHEPLFRKFPHDIPKDTEALWWRKVLVHYFQGQEQPCLFCGRVGTCHVLSCGHVVCGACFDGESYSACPVCERRVDRSSPFFKPTPEQRAEVPDEQVTFKRLDLGGGQPELDREAQALFVSLCARKQALSPDDSGALKTLLRAYGERALAWVPEEIPVREVVALVFGELFRVGNPEGLLPHARRYLRTATDVLRFLAAYSDADPALQGQKTRRAVDVLPKRRWWGEKADEKLLAASKGRPQVTMITLRRFRMEKLRRPLRRAVLAMLDGLDERALTEDMLRHRSYWVWAGEFLHPHEYAGRFARAARAFAVVRGKGPDGAPAPAFKGFYGQVEAAALAGDAEAMVAKLSERPGELARRLDHALRVASRRAPADPQATRSVVDAFVKRMQAYSTPVLLTLRGLLPTRTRTAPIRVFWPKGQTARGVASPDRRSVLPADAVGPAVRAVEAELLRRFGQNRPFGDAIVDAALRDIIAPFNERTASPAAVALPRGSRVAVPKSKIARLFLHWCQPEHGGYDTDLDLSVAFYDEQWRYAGVCSYYELTFAGKDGGEIALSSGDLRSAPFPEGASEFVDLRRDLALREGLRYAVMVVNSYAGMAFGELERAFAGLMLRDDPEGAHFDPRTVALRFNLQGEHGVFVPLVFDLHDELLHWVDVYSTGQLAMNNVATSNKDITRICSSLIAYFTSGVRMSMFDLATLQAAARCERVFVRDGGTARRYDRRPGEERRAFLDRLAGMDCEATDAPLPGPGGPPVLAALFRGDIDLPDGSASYALFRERGAPTLAASDLLA